MEGHPGYEDRGAAPVCVRADSSDAATKRAFLLLEDERRSLAAQLRPPWRPSGRYEDLSLVVMLARLERDWLGQRLADWARPWGTAPRTKLEAEIDHLGKALRRIGRWLPTRMLARADGRARDRAAAIATKLEEPGVWGSASEGPAPTAPRLGPPSRTRVALIAGLCLLAAGLGAVVLAAPQRGDAPDSAGLGPAAGAGRDPGSPEVHIPRGSGQGGPGRGQLASRPGRAKTQSSARAQRSAQSALAVPEAAPAPHVPAPAAQPVAAPQPAPGPVPAGSPSSSASSQAKGGGGCPPEFGYEC